MFVNGVWQLVMIDLFRRFGARPNPAALSDFPQADEYINRENIKTTVRRNEFPGLWKAVASRATSPKLILVPPEHVSGLLRYSYDSERAQRFLSWFETLSVEPPREDASPAAVEIHEPADEPRAVTVSAQPAPEIAPDEVTVEDIIRTFIVRGNDVRVDSRDVARFFGKEHRNVIQAYRNLPVSDGYRELNFQPFKINDLAGEFISHFEMTAESTTSLFSAK